MRRKLLPPGHPDLAVALHTLAGILNGQRKYAEAEPYCREALEIRRKALPAGHPQIATAACDLGWLLQMQGKPTEAEPLFREALQIRTEKFGPTAGPTTKTAAFLADLLDKTNRPEEAAALRAKRGRESHDACFNAPCQMRTRGPATANAVEWMEKVG